MRDKVTERTILFEAKKYGHPGTDTVSGAEAPLAVIDPTSAWLGPAPPREWIIPGWVPRGVVTALYGDGGIGKSLFAQQLLTSTALGGQLCGLDVSRCRALGIFCEDDSAELHRRQEAINRALGCEMADLGSLRVVSRFGEDNPLVRFDRDGTGSLTAFHGQLMATCQAWRPGVVVLDTAADLFSASENDRSQVRWFIQSALGIVSRTFDCGVLLLAHPSQAGLASGEGTGGSTAWNNTVRSRLYLSRETGPLADPNARVLARKKSNYGPRDDSLRLVWHDGALRREERVPGHVGVGDQIVTVVFDEIERAWNSTRSWSNAPQTRGSGRYFPQWVHAQHALPEKTTEALLSGWLQSGLLTVELHNRATKQYGLKVVRRPDDVF